MYLAAGKGRDECTSALQRGRAWFGSMCIKRTASEALYFLMSGRLLFFCALSYAEEKQQRYPVRNVVTACVRASVSVSRDRESRHDGTHKGSVLHSEHVTRGVEGLVY